MAEPASDPAAGTAAVSSGAKNTVVLSTGPEPQRWRIRIRGLVQGVGFRPHVYRQAVAHSLAGFALNDGEGVLIEAQGAAAALVQFRQALSEQAPPLARIDQVTTAPLPPAEGMDFRIASSRSENVATAAIPADVAICAACLEELFDPSNRRYLHPFIACSHCGPRISMAERLPYDRKTTTMGHFAFCGACDAEYGAPDSRRFHAEPIACHDCGPRLSEDPLDIARQLGEGRIVALKGIGGYHLLCDARHGDLVEKLRRRKQRDAKPFAVMVLNTVSGAYHVHMSPGAIESLEGHERPVVVAPRCQGSDRPLPDALASGLDSLGLMLPYTGLHYLLFHALLGSPSGTAWLEEANDLALLMTSANVSGRPLVSRRREAETELATIADLLVHHDRRIARPSDDSVVRDNGHGPCVPIRRARGWVPGALRQKGDGAAILACGAHLKNTVTLTRGALAYPSTHIGDLGTAASIAFQAGAVEQLLQMLDSRPERVACDWHPDYASTRLAERLAERFDVPLVRVQHHHAHIAAVLAEHRVEEPVLGVALDGHGMGARGESWGGELLRVSPGGFTRLGHFRPLLALGGDRAAREPWRMAAGVLAQLGRGEEIEKRFSSHAAAAPLGEMLNRGNVPETTAAGRLFDAASALLGVCELASFEGQAPMLLEARVQTPQALPGGFRLKDGVLDFRPLLLAIADLKDAHCGADWLHGTLVKALSRWVIEAAEASGLRTVALGGGCMINSVLAVQLPAALEAAGLRVLSARRMPPNDAAISLGQAWVAARQPAPVIEEI